MIFDCFPGKLELRAILKDVLTVFGTFFFELLVKIERFNGGDLNARPE